jgi:antitoxin ParD1/3/4
MAKTTSFILGDHFTRFINDQVERGRYASASDVIRDSLRLLEEREIRLSELRNALVAGEESGPGEPFDFDKFISRKSKAYRPARSRRR